MDKRPPLYDHHHAVQFYSDDDSLFTTVAGFLSQGLVDGHPAVIIATKAHRNAILEQLRGRLAEVPKAHSLRGVHVLDAHDTLDLFMDGDHPDPQRFEESIGRLIASLVEGRESCMLVRAYGEMVDVLWKEGRTHAAIRLEMLWNRLAQRYGFALLCGYSMGNFFKATTGFEDICREHTHVVGPLYEAPSVARRRG
jgi:hypothetical protein